MSAHQPDVGAVPAGGSSSSGGDSLPPEELRELSLPELVKQLAEQTTTLIQQEIQLAKVETKEAVDLAKAEMTDKAKEAGNVAKAEMTDKAKEAGKGAGMLGAAGGLGLLAGIAFTAFLILVLGTFLPDWLAALIVTVVYAAIAAVLASKGKKQLQSIDPKPQQTIETVKAMDPKPQQAIATVKEDIEWAKTQNKSVTR